jgi:hypothetical protein
MLESRLHEHHLLRYEVELLNQPFQQSDKTAIVHFFDENNKRHASNKYAFYNKDIIYDLLDHKKSLNLEGVYVKEFSLAQYREERKMEADAMIDLFQFTAKNSFFDCELKVDFTHAHFKECNTDFESAVFGNGVVDFTGTDFGQGHVNFRGTKFGNGSLIFRSVKFGNGDISFNQANFGSGSIIFSDAFFSNGHVDFSHSFFGNGTVDFKFAKFSSGNISFEKANFGIGKKDFKNVEFGGGRIDFKRVNFNDGDVAFDGAEFGNGKVSFRNSKFGNGYKSFEQADFADGDVQFDFVDFGKGTISFNQAKVAAISFGSCHLDSFIDLRFESCLRLDLSSVIIRDILDLIHPSGKPMIQEMNLSELRVLGRLFINWHESNIREMIYNQKETSLMQKADQFRVLKENFRINGQYEDEDAAYLEFKRCEVRAKLQTSLAAGGTISLLAYQIYYFQRYVFDYVGRYATAPRRVLANAVLVVLMFSIYYYLSTNFFPDSGRVATALPSALNHSQEFWNSVYFSAITFCTVGYGDYFADGNVKIAAAIEGFSGIFLMSYFTVAFVRKILR